MRNSKRSIGRWVRLGALTLTGAGASLLPSTAHAQEEAPVAVERVRPVRVTESWVAEPGLQLGLRSGYATGTGVVYSGFNVQDGSNGYVPIILDLGARVFPALYLGAYGQLGLVTNKTNATSCPTSFNCSTQDWRVGLEGDLHFLPHFRFDPYIGINTGYEILHSSINGNMMAPVAPGVVAPAGVNADATDRGWEFVGLTLGSDYRLSRYSAIGAFLSASLNEYNIHEGNQTINVAGQTATTSLPDVRHGAHEIYILGLRGTFDVPFESSTPEVAAR